MKAFKHLNADSLQGVVETLGKHGEDARVIAGGTDLLGTLKDNIHPEYPEVLVDLKGIEGLAYVEEDDQGLKIGAMTRLHDVETNPVVREKYSALAQAAHAVASPQIRRMGTIGGNICQETRCWYYRYPENVFHCMRKGGNVCRALLGENRYHSIFGAARVGDTPCVSSCPAETYIPLYLCKIREGNLPAAARVLLAANPMPAITGRVCPHICQEGCNRGEFDEAVSIRDIERFTGDYILDHAHTLVAMPAVTTGKKVAIIGSGPAGLSAAFYLRKLGHGVTIFDRHEEAGGMLMYAIPSYRLPKDLVRRVTHLFEDLGVEFRLNVEVGTDVTLEEIRNDFDSVFLATGAWKQPAIGLEGEASAVYGLDFLADVSRGNRNTPGQKVIVIGGGDVAVDVAISARRLGAAEVTMVCLESREEMPAHRWEIEQAVEEDVSLMTSWGPARVLQTAGRITGLELVRCTSVFDAEGLFAPTFDTAVTETLEADQVILAVGQGVDLSYVESALEIERGRIEVDPMTQATPVPGVFAGGDLMGLGTVIEAIAAGRRAALGINAYLGHDGDYPAEEAEIAAEEPLLKMDSASLEQTDSARMPQRPVPERTLDMEDALGLTQTEIEAEADRCLNCGCVAVCPSDIAPVLVALDAKIKTTKRTIAAEDFFAAGIKSSTVLDHDELVVEIQLPAPQPGYEQTYSKFRLRQSIDFPLVSVAAALNVASGHINDVRLVLGAVAPIPMRARAVEDFLRGKAIDGAIVDEAAEIAVTTALPLGRNAYKVQITKALVKRALLSLGKR